MLKLPTIIIIVGNRHSNEKKLDITDIFKDSMSKKSCPTFIVYSVRHRGLKVYNIKEGVFRTG